MRLLGSTISWVVALLGVLLSYIAIIELDTAPVFRDGFPAEWQRALPLALFALIPPLAVAIALRNRQHAGLLLLAASPLLGAASLPGVIQTSAGLALVGGFFEAALLFAIPGAFYVSVR